MNQSFFFCIFAILGRSWERRLHQVHRQARLEGVARLWQVRSAQGCEGGALNRAEQRQRQVSTNCNLFEFFPVSCVFSFLYCWIWINEVEKERPFLQFDSSRCPNAALKNWTLVDIVWRCCPSWLPFRLTYLADGVGISNDNEFQHWTWWGQNHGTSLWKRSLLMWNTTDLPFLFCKVRCFILIKRDLR